MRGFRIIGGDPFLRLGGGGGIQISGGSFSPSQLSGLSLWIAGRFITGLNDGDTIATPVEMSGNNNITTQADAAQRAHYKTNIVNGLPVLRFDRTVNLYAFPNSIVGPLTIFAVAKQITASNKYMLTTGNGGAGVRVSADGTWNVFLNTTISSTQKINSQFRMACVVARAANDVDLITDSTKVTVTSGTGYSPAGRSIGSYAGSADFWGGDLAELIIYNRALSVAEVESVRAYLTALYALPFG